MTCDAVTFTFPQRLPLSLGPRSHDVALTRAEYYMHVSIL